MPHPLQQTPTHDRGIVDPVSVAEALRQLSLAIRTLQLYPEQHPQRKGATEPLQQRLEALLKLSPALELDISRSALTCHGTTVMRGDDVTSIPRMLHGAGLRSLTLHRGLTGEETERLVEMFALTAGGTTSGGDDVVTLLWQANLTHVTHEAVDYQLFTDAGITPFSAISVGTPALVVVDSEPPPDVVARALEAEQLLDEIRRHLEEMPAPIFEISREEREELLREVAAEKEPERVSRDLARILEETLRLERDERAFVELLKSLSAALAGRIAEGQLGIASVLVETLNRVRATREDLSDTMQQALEETLAGTFGEPAIRQWTALLDEDPVGQAEPLRDLIQVFPVERLTLFVEVLGRLDTMRARRTLIDLLLPRVRETMAPLLPFVSDGRWYLVRNLVTLLSAGDPSRVLPVLRTIARHPEPRVRHEVVISVRRWPPALRQDFLTTAIRDVSAAVRIAALRELVSFGREGFAPLVKHLDGFDVPRGHRPERLALFESLAAADPDHGAMLLRVFLEKRTLLLPAYRDDVREDACRALARVQDEAATRVLQRAAKDPSPRVRATATAALQDPARITAATRRFG